MSEQTKELVDAVRAMREAQRGFFASTPGSKERQAFFRESKRLENKVDTLLTLVSI